MAETTPSGAEKKLAAAQTIGKSWMESVKTGDLASAMKLWGYMALDGTDVENLRAALAAQQGELGALRTSSLLLDRCVIDLEGGEEKKARGTYITLCYFNQYEKAAQREYVVLHEPEKQGNGLKIIGLRREAPVTGRRAAFDMAADIGQMVLLRVNNAPPTQWQPFLDEAQVLAAALKVSLPDIPPASAQSEETTGGKLMEILMQKVGNELKKLGKASGHLEAQTILHAYGLLSVYDPGEALPAQIANLVAESAKQSALPAHLWQPLVRAVIDKKPRSEVSELVHGMAMEISHHLGEQEGKAALIAGAKDLLDKAFANMARLPSYQVRAELLSGERRATMDASLALDGMDLTLLGFDGQKQRRIVTKEGFWISTDEGKSWLEDKDKETAVGLLRTLTSPVDPGFKLTEKEKFTLLGEEIINGEKLLHVARIENPKKPPHEYWVLISQRGPVIRRANLTMSFGDISAQAVLSYLKLGKSGPITPPVQSP